MNEKKREEIALFRYRLIVPFLSAEEIEWGCKGEILKRIAKEEKSIPFSKKTSLSESTIRTYLRLYRQGGFDVLKPKSRTDRGQSRKIPPEVLEKAIILKKEQPRRSIRKIIQIIEADQLTPPGLLKESTLARLFKEKGLVRKKLVQAQKDFRAFGAERPNQIWQSDILYGPYLPDPNYPERKKRTYLVAFLDDFSRLIPHAEFFWAEKLPHLEITLKKAIIKRGIPEAIYVDNGQVYSAHRIDAICAELGIRKITCKPYSPEGKGKIERFFRTVRDDFLTELQLQPVAYLHELNRLFWAWQEVDYHQRNHSKTSEAPVKRWRQNIGLFLRAVQEKELEQLFLWRKIRRVSKLGTVSVEGQQFEVDTLLRGQKVEVRFNPLKLREVYIYLDGRFLQKALPDKPSRWNQAKKLTRTKNTQTGPQTQSGIQYLQHLKEQHQKQRQADAQKLLPSEKNLQSSAYTSAHFIKVIAQSLGKKLDALHATEIEHIQSCWDSYGPFHPADVAIALGKAILQKGRNQHIDYYLDAIRLQHLKKGVQP